MTSFFGLLFILCFAFAPIVCNFYGAASVACPCTCTAVADEPTTHIVPFLCPLYKLFYELASCIIQ